MCDEGERVHIVAIIMLLSVPLGVTACGGNEISTVDPWSTAPRFSPSEISDVAQIDEIRTAGHQDYDRIVIVFSSDQLPGYAVRFIEEAPTACGSGQVVDISAPHVLEVRLEPARGYNESGESTLDHSKQDLPLSTLGEYAVSCDFEAVFTLVAGIDGGGEFRVSELRSPARIVVDVKHEAP